eukprot:gnl/TRDRNA2_/TRDRNA2_148180_c0_seq1.p1 gnl/TRDRNA2_/TRDRNA2_148180_c0~~gnl/TRDRNA2_/TRDRNA2_148180_c0_seq1.p1  ORF type:complete len:283 (+),score=51.33 gnl/TRDRNA2_/TRDRNA2_148180_c0_seq1:109-957(+)
MVRSDASPALAVLVFWTAVLSSFAKKKGHYRFDVEELLKEENEFDGKEAGTPKRKSVSQRLAEEKGSLDTDELRCDACLVIVQHIAADFLMSESKRKRPLKDDVASQSVAKVCGDELQDGPLRIYGTRLTDGKHRLAGPGAIIEKDGPMKRMGGMIGGNLNDACVAVTQSSPVAGALYSKFQKHVAAPARGRAYSNEAAEGVRKLAKELCMEKKAKQKSKGKSSQAENENESLATATEDTSANVLGSCSKAHFFFSLSGFEDVVQSAEKEARERARAMAEEL